MLFSFKFTLKGATIINDYYLNKKLRQGELIEKFLRINTH